MLTVQNLRFPQRHSASTCDFKLVNLRNIPDASMLKT